MLQKFCFWLEFWSKNKQHSKILFALSISSLPLEFEIPFELVNKAGVFHLKLIHWILDYVFDAKSFVKQCIKNA